jgi:hypothetical protein
MSNQSHDARSKRSKERHHSSYSGGNQTAYYGGGVEVQCQYCPGQAFRRSRLRMQDLQGLLFMRYPVRCLRCGQRQTVSFAIASVSVPSHIKQRRHRRSAEKFPEAGFPATPQEFAQHNRPDHAEAEKHETHLSS